MRMSLGLGLSRRAASSGGGGNVAPVITGVPTISGTATVGNTLTASPASVTGTPSPTRTWQWYRDGVARAGETAITYTIVSGDQGAEITVEQIETNVAGSDTATSLGETIPYLPIDPATLSPTAWFRPNDTTTVFQTDNGNTPVTAAGQTIGLLLGMDTSGGRGSEILTNPGGPFTATTGWTARNSATLSVVSNRMRVAGGAAFSYAEAPVAGVTVGGTYEALGNAVFVSGSDNNVRFETSNLAGANGLTQTGPTGPGRLVRVIFTPTATTFYLRLVSNDSGDTYDWDYASVREVTGRHARQATSGDRPTYRQGGNGVYYIESVSSDAINWTAPAGTYTVAYVIPDGTVTILTGQSLSGATNIMLASQVVEYIAISGSLTTAQEGGLTAYLEGIANP